MSNWIETFAMTDIEEEGAKRFDHGSKTYAVYRSANDEIFCTDGLCTNDAVHLADGLMMDYEIECPKHSGVFDVRAGEAKRLPACKNPVTYQTRVDGDRVMINIG